MRTCTALFFIVVVLISGQHSLASSDDAMMADHEALRSLRSNVEQAINSGNMAELQNVLAKDFTIIAVDRTVLKTPRDLIEYWDKKFHNDASPVISMRSALSPSILTQFFSPDRGFCHGTSIDTYTLKNNRKVAMESYWSAILVKEEGIWKIQFAHASVNFLDNPVLEIKSMSWFRRIGVALGIFKLPGEIQ